MSAYSDLGKQARDVLQKGYNDSRLRVGLVHILPHGFTLASTGWYDHVSKKSDAVLEVELKCNSSLDKVNLSMKRGFSLNNGASFSLAASGGDRWGIKNAGISFNQTGKVGLSYYNSWFKGDLSLAPGGGDTALSIAVTPTMCFSRPPVALGLTTNWLPSEVLLPFATSLAAGYTDNAKNLSACVFVDNDVSRASCSIYGRASPTVELACRAGFDLEESKPSAEAGIRHQIVETTSVSAKINNDFNFSINCCHDLIPGIRASSSLVFDVASLNLSKTKLGIGIDIEHDWFTTARRPSSTPLPPPPAPVEASKSSTTSSTTSSDGDAANLKTEYAKIGPPARKRLQRVRVSELREPNQEADECDE